MYDRSGRVLVDLISKTQNRFDGHRPSSASNLVASSRLALVATFSNPRSVLPWKLRRDESKSGSHRSHVADRPFAIVDPGKLLPGEGTTCRDCGTRTAHSDLSG